MFFYALKLQVLDVFSEAVSKGWGPGKVVRNWTFVRDLICPFFPKVLHPDPSIVFTAFVSL